VLTYVYNVKREATERAVTLLTAVAILLGIHAWIASALLERGPLRLEVKVLMGLPLVVLLVAAVLLLRVLRPQVSDPTSSLEAESIVRTPRLRLLLNAAGNQHNQIVKDLVKEIRAVAEVQTRRDRVIVRALDWLCLGCTTIFVEAALLLVAFL
jgi:hypothetical protein